MCNDKNVAVDTKICETNDLFLILYNSLIILNSVLLDCFQSSLNYFSYAKTIFKISHFNTVSN